MTSKLKRLIALINNEENSFWTIELEKKIDVIQENKKEDNEKYSELLQFLAKMGESEFSEQDNFNTPLQFMLKKNLKERRHIEKLPLSYYLTVHSNK